jgi:hypothetical protein
MKNREAGSSGMIAANSFRKWVPPRKAKLPLLGDSSASRRDAALVTNGVLPAWEER